MKVRKKLFFLACTLISYILFVSTVAYAAQSKPQSIGNGTIDPYQMTVQALNGNEGAELHIKVLPITPAYSIPGELKKVQIKSFDVNGSHLFTENFFNIPMNNGEGIIKLNEASKYLRLEVSVSVQTSQSIDQEILREGNITLLLTPDLIIDSIDAPQITLINKNCNVNIVIKEINGDEGANFKVEVLEDTNVLASSDSMSIPAGGTLTSSLNLNFKQLGNHILKARITQVTPGEYDTANDEASFGIQTNILPAPQVISVEAGDTGRSPGLNTGDTLTIKFDTDTNVPLAAAKTDIDKLIDFGQDKSLGSNYTGTWIDAQTLLVTILDASGGNIAVGDVIKMKLGGNITNADNTSEISNSSCVIGGTFGENKVFTVHLNDPNLETAVRTALYIPQGDITNLDMTKLTRLVVSYKGIKDLSGLEYAVNLNFLDLSNNQITVVKPLENLQSLNALYLNGNLIGDVSGLSNLKNLKYLGISQNAISDISPLKSLTAIEKLYASDNRIIDISVLKDMINLQELDLSYNAIIEVPALEKLNKLTSLSLSYNSISNVSGLSSIVSLVSLSLEKNQCSDFSAVQYLTSLQYLNCSQNIIEDVSFLGKLTNLKKLYINNNKITDISSMDGLINLDTFDMSSNPVSDVSALGRLIRLNSVKISLTKVSTIASLQALKDLQVFYAKNCEIIDISPLGGLTNINTLILSGNKISDISSLQGLTGLRWVNLSDNQISDVSYLVSNSGIGSGDYVDLTNNQLNLVNSSKNMEYIQNLISRGAIVRY